MYVELIVKRVKELEVEYPDGFTYSIGWCEVVIRGYPVGFKETQDSFGEEGLRKCIQHALEHDKFIGMWVNPDGVKQYDSIRIYMDKSKAIEAAKANGQHSIWDLNEMREIKI